MGTPLPLSPSLPQMEWSRGTPDVASPRQPHPPQWTSFRGLWSFVFPIMPWASDRFARLPLPWPLLGRIPEQSTLSLGAQGSGWSLMGPVPHQSLISWPANTRPTTYILQVAPGNKEGSAGPASSDRKGMGSRQDHWPGPRVNKPQIQTPDETMWRLRETLCQDGEAKTFITHVNCCHPRPLSLRSLPRALSSPC